MKVEGAFLEYRGTWIVLEGPDMSGTTTAAQKVSQEVFGADKRHHVLTTREPTYGPFGKRIREILLSPESRVEDTGEILAELFMKDRLDHTYNFVLPALSKGGVVIQDRGMYSTLAYQGVYQGRPIEQIVDWHKWMPVVPSAVLVFDATLETLLGRRGGTAETHKEMFDMEEGLKKIIAAYQQIPEIVAKNIPEHPPVHVIDANQDKEGVLAQCLAIVNPLLPAADPDKTDYTTKAGKPILR